MTTQTKINQYSLRNGKEIALYRRQDHGPGGYSSRPYWQLRLADPDETIITWYRYRRLGDAYKAFDSLVWSDLNEATI